MNEMKPQLQVHVCIFCTYDQVKASLSSSTLNLKGFVPMTVVMGTKLGDLTALKREIPKFPITHLAKLE